MFELVCFLIVAIVAVNFGKTLLIRDFHDNREVLIEGQLYKIENDGAGSTYTIDQLKNVPDFDF